MRKNGKPVCIRTYDSLEEEVSEISLPQAAAAVSAARGIFSEVTLPSSNGSSITFLDKGHPLSLIDPTKLALVEITKLVPEDQIESIISIGSGAVSDGDVQDLLRLSYTKPYHWLPLFSMLQRKRIPEMAVVKERLRLQNPEVQNPMT